MTEYFDWLQKEAEAERMDEEIANRHGGPEWQPKTKYETDEVNAREFIDEVTSYVQSVIDDNVLNASRASPASPDTIRSFVILEFAKRLAVTTRLMGEEIERRKQAERRITELEWKASLYEKSQERNHED